jgi:hypothetical protein
MNEAGSLAIEEPDNLQLQTDRKQNGNEALQLQPDREQATQKKTIAICVSVKDENAEDITEWVQYYRCPLHDFLHCHTIYLSCSANSCKQLCCVGC